MESPPDLIVYNAFIYTVAPSRPRASAMAVSNGAITALGGDELLDLRGPSTELVDAAGAFVMPGLADGHIHFNLGGSQAAYELPISPLADIQGILDAVSNWASTLGPEEWVVGGIIGATMLDKLAAENWISKLDEAAGGRPAMLRDDSLHNRWVNSRALELMGVDESTPDPPEGKMVRDSAGKHTGVLYESAISLAETAFRKSVADLGARIRGAMLKSLEIVRSFGITSVQEAATASGTFKELIQLDREDKLTCRIVASAIAKVFVEDGFFGEELFSYMKECRGKLLLPDFMKIFLDGVPMTRTSVMLGPYRCCHGGAHEFDDVKVVPLVPDDELVGLLRRCYELGIGAKMHATGDGAARQALDAVAKVRTERGPGPIFQIAHAEYLHPMDIPRMKELNVVADMSPYIWYPCVLQDSIAKEIPEMVYERSWPTREFLDAGVLVACGSDWPVAATTPDPWTGMQTLITRRNPDPSVPGVLCENQRVTREEAIEAFTAGPTAAMGLDKVGRLSEGFSADFIFLDRDLLACDEGEIYKTKVTRTYLQGKLVYEA
ncbi:putative TIM-barrel fold metal-dependent hydrolase [Hyaloraphidium curvatum]|nr:putative TIM-barrel fold metal-dependent hydrolase [Hyaloraphidium curvatum]